MKRGENFELPASKQGKLNEFFAQDDYVKRNVFQFDIIGIAKDNALEVKAAMEAVRAPYIHTS